MCSCYVIERPVIAVRNNKDLERTESAEGLGECDGDGDAVMSTLVQ